MKNDNSHTGQTLHKFNSGKTKEMTRSLAILVNDNTFDRTNWYVFGSVRKTFDVNRNVHIHIVHWTHTHSHAIQLFPLKKKATLERKIIFKI